MSEPASIPIIDISPLICPSGEADAAALERLKSEWDQAFRQLGFAIITGHGMDRALVESLYSKAKEEFFHLPAEEKLKYFKNQGYGNGGFVPMGVEAVGRTKNGQPSHGADLVESLTYGLGRHDPAELPASLRAEIEAYCCQMINLLHPLMRLSAMALHLDDADFFAPYFTQPRITFRLAYYPPQMGLGNEDPHSGHERIRYGAHTDYIGYTILRQDPKVGGLQVRHPSIGEWISVPLVPDSFVVNAGDLIQHWTNGLWKSNLHRVVNPRREEAHLGRLSMVFFTGPNEDAVVAPLEACVRESGGEPLYQPVVARDYLAMKLAKSNT